MRKKRVLAISSTLCLTLGALSLSSCDSTGDVINSALEDSKILLSVSKNTLKVSETVTIDVTCSYDKSTLLWVSDDENVVTVNNGVVTAVGEGKAKVYVYPKEHFYISSYVEFVVSGDTSKGEAIKTLSIDTTNVKTLYRLGETLDLTGLVVKVDGEEVSDYSTNPRSGTTLQVLGELEVVVSHSGCESQSFTITVEENPVDTTLLDLVTKLGETKNYNFNSTLTGPFLNEETGQVEEGSMSYDYTFNEDKFYLKITAFDEVFDGYDFGYVNTEKGVLKYTIVDEIVTPICYESHQNFDYREVSVYKDENVFTLEGMPVRQTNGYYLVTDSDLINEIVACADANSSIVYNTMKSVKGYVLSEDSFKFVVDCGSVGELDVTFSSIDTADVAGVDAYLEENGPDIEVSDDLTAIMDKVNANNYTYTYSYKDENNNSALMATAYMTDSYYVIVYSDEYLEFYKKTHPTETLPVSTGKLLKDDKVYDLTITKDTEGEVTVTSIESSDNPTTFHQDGGYFSSFPALEDANADMYTYEEIPELGAEGFTVSGDSLSYDFFEWFGYSLETTGLVPFKFGFYYSKGVTEALDQLYLLEVTFDLTGKYYTLGLVLSNLGTTSYKPVEEYMATL